MLPVIVSQRCVVETIAILQEAGSRSSERVVMWLGSRNADAIEVKEVYVPEQQADFDFFHIPPEGMQSLLSKLCQKRLMIAAQVHSHPGEAFHSEADDVWAIVRHAGALSLVLPHFALNTKIKSFKTDAAVFVLSSANQWEEVASPAIESHYRIQ
jgi:proteasome lid subunit RPN8/RPN11